MPTQIHTTGTRLLAGGRRKREWEHCCLWFYQTRQSLASSGLWCQCQQMISEPFVIHMVRVLVNELHNSWQICRCVLSAIPWHLYITLQAFTFPFTILTYTVWHCLHSLWTCIVHVHSYNNWGSKTTYPIHVHPCVTVVMHSRMWSWGECIYIPGYIACSDKYVYRVGVNMPLFNNRFQ